MTARARCLALVGLVGLIAGLATERFLVSLLGLTLLSWLGTDWVFFRIQIRRELSKLKIRRWVNDRPDETGILWAQRIATVRIELQCEPFRFAPNRLFRDIVPEVLEILDGVDSSSGSVASKRTRRYGLVQRMTQTVLHSFLATLQKLDQDIADYEKSALAASTTKPTPFPSQQCIIEHETSTATIAYRIRPRCAGEVRFPGIRIRFDDVMGFFREDRVVQQQHRFRILPHYVEFGETNPITKRLNSIPQHGVHRQSRPGLGFELLELREYVEGDPPKSIAWKASARREVLMTRQYESEVPLKIQLIIDSTSMTRIGGYGARSIDQFAPVAASIARLATASGDFVGTYLIDDDGFERTQARPGNPGFYAALQAISKHASDRKPAFAKLMPMMIPSALAICSERYPELLEPRFNPSRIHGMFTSMAMRNRVQLASVLATLYQLNTLQATNLLMDDQALANALQRFLCDEGTPWTNPVISMTEVSNWRVPPGADQMVKALNTATMLAHDNEVFVLFLDFVDNENSLDNLCNAIRVAKGRHHRVLVVCASPHFQRASEKQDWSKATNAAQIRSMAHTERVNKYLNHFKKRMIEIGTPLSISGQTNVIPLVLSELAIARSGRHAGVRTHR